MNEEAQRALLQRFEPVIRFTRGERFFPMDVAHYVEKSSLWVERPGEEPLCLIPPGKLTLDDLGVPHPDEFGAVHYLKLTQPLTPSQLASYTLETRHAADPEERFHGGRGRLARVGYTSRFVDALFALSLLARGRVPGDAAAAAKQLYNQLREEKEPFRYHGRVLRQNGWVILQYWYFYLFNNWRSGFWGANDHEADWEMACLYLSESDAGEVKPEWVAYATHDYSGDDLRRRWDDPEVKKVGEHPVIFTGAGSHASYFTPGEYLAELELPFLRPLIAFTDRAQRLWHQQLRQYRRDEVGTEADEGFSNIFRIPFVDYARGDGLAIGPGQQAEWSPPRLLGDESTWVTHFRGLWGLYTRDPFAGEDAPAGPMFNRDGSVRRAWYDPIGWAGLDKVPPPDEALTVTRAQQAAIRAQQATLREQVERQSHELQGLGVEAAAMRQEPHLSKLHDAHMVRIALLSEEVNHLRAQLALNDALLDSLAQHAARLEAGELEPVRAHIHRAHQPATEETLRASRLAELWAATSIGVMLIGFVTLFEFQRSHILSGVVAILGLFIFIEAGFRGRLTHLVASLTVLLASIAALVLFYEFYWQVLLATVLATGGYILWQNLHELRR